MTKVTLTTVTSNRKVPDILHTTEKTLVLLSAPSGAGKTTLCDRIVDAARAAGMPVGGVLCPSVFDAGMKTGIEQVDVATGERRQLARREDGGAWNTIGPWKFDETVVEWGNAIFASLNGEGLTVVDELGPLELARERGYTEAVRLLDAGRYCTALVVVRPVLLGVAQARWPRAKVLHMESETA